MVNENRAEGTARSFGGKVQEGVGQMVGSAGMQARGEGEQAARQAQDMFGSALDTAEQWIGSITETTKNRPLAALLAAVSVGYMIRMLTHSRRR